MPDMCRLFIARMFVFVSVVIACERHPAATQGQYSIFFCNYVPFRLLFRIRMDVTFFCRHWAHVRSSIPHSDASCFHSHTRARSHTHTTMSGFRAASTLIRLRLINEKQLNGHRPWRIGAQKVGTTHFPTVNQEMRIQNKQFRPDECELGPCIDSSAQKIVFKFV